MRFAEQAQAFESLLAPTLIQQLLDVREPYIRRELQVAAQLDRTRWRRWRSGAQAGRHLLIERIAGMRALGRGFD